jgi:glycosyltransferase involved in cell wall biosynthesis
MRILLFSRSLHKPAGTEKMTTLLANHLDNSGHEVSILVLENFNKPFFKLNDNIRLFNISQYNVDELTKNYFKSLYIYSKRLRVIRPELIIDFGISMSVLSLPLSKIYKCRVISWEHFNTFINWHTFSSKLGRWMAAKLSYKVVLLTEKDKCNFQLKYNSKNAICIQNPITIANDNNVNINTGNVLAIGRLTEQKGFSYLLKAWKLVSEKSKDWKLIIVGEGELKQVLINQIEHLGLTEYVDILSPTIEIDKHYKNASIFVMSSLFEGLPLVLLEAKSFGLPIVSFDCETGPGIIVRDNTDGFLVPVGDVKSLSEKLLLLIQDSTLRQNFSNNALKDKSRFSLVEFYTTWDSLLKTINS